MNKDSRPEIVVHPYNLSYLEDQEDLGSRTHLSNLARHDGTGYNDRYLRGIGRRITVVRLLADEKKLK
jgi:hypothetical protein